MESPIEFDASNPENKGFSIARGTGLNDNVDIEKLTTNIEKGIKVKVQWDGNVEYVLIKDVEVNVVE